MYLNPGMKKRILTGLLTAFLLVNSLVVTAFAEESDVLQPEQTEQTAQPEPENTVPDEPEQEEQPAAEPEVTPEPEVIPEPEVSPEPTPETETGSGSETEEGGALAPEEEPEVGPESDADEELPSETEPENDSESEPETETGTEPEGSDESEEEAEEDSGLPPLPENTSSYGEPEGYDLLGIYERVYRGAPLTMNEAMRFMEGELSEALNRIADCVDHEDVYVRYNGGLEHTYRACMAEVAAVFCALEGWEDPMTLKSEKLSTAQVELLRSIYWNMSSIYSAYREDVSYSYAEDESGEILEDISYHVQIDVDFISASEYLSAPSAQQQSILDLVLSEPMRSDIIRICSGELSDTDYGTSEIIAALPEDLDPMRRSVVESACSLVGRVSYFWGGTAEHAGWDERWSVPKAVIDDTTGLMGDVYPYGLDCAGFVTWAFINACGDESAFYSIGQGVESQFYNCRRIEMSEVQPGDIMFSYGLGHVGIVVGFTAEGELLACHSSMSGTGDIRMETISAAGLDMAAVPYVFYDAY